MAKIVKPEIVKTGGLPSLVPSGVPNTPANRIAVAIGERQRGRCSVDVLIEVVDSGRGTSGAAPPGGPTLEPD